MCCRFFGIHRQLIQRVQSLPSFSMKHKLDESKANVSLCSSIWDQWCTWWSPGTSCVLTVAVLARASQQRSVLASGWLLIAGPVLGCCEFPSIS